VEQHANRANILSPKKSHLVLLNLARLCRYIKTCASSFSGTSNEIHEIACGDGQPKVIVEIPEGGTPYRRPAAII
jgi:hypothetical protein